MMRLIQKGIMDRLQKLFFEFWRPVFCILVHLFLLWAVFDTYYKSPLVHGMTPHGEAPDDAAPASRLVLIVADGLRAHSLYENIARAPFLKKMMSQFGSWGVSHTRVPTESRPGHVAIIAGFYEDVSAVAKGWQENPVEFDSVFNESRYTWSWGSPDILPMFAKGATGQHVFTSSYGSEREDFASSDPSKLDTWVFERVKAFFSSPNETLAVMLRRTKIIYFLHLLGLDTSGHGYKPLSMEYSRNIKVVDEGVAEMYEIIEQFFQHDGRTAYVFTSDHGMTDWGSHGAGDDHETMTPLIAWGAGISRPQTPDFDSNAFNFAIKSAKAFGRKDVNQADIAPLISALIGINMPMNSVGILPMFYLNVSQRYGALAACSNFKQLVEQMEVQRHRKHNAFRVLFKEFPDLTPFKLKLIMGEIEKLFAQKRLAAAGQLCQQWSPTVVEGLLYYHRYERPFLTFCVAVTFALLELSVWRFAVEKTASGLFQMVITPKFISIFTAASLLIVFLFWICSFPLARSLYVLTPMLLAVTSRPLWNQYALKLWHSVDYIRGIRIILLEFKNFKLSIPLVKRLASVLLAFAFVELLVWVFSYRWILSVGLWVLAIWPQSNPRVGSSFRTAWIIICLVTSIFPFLPTVGKSSNPEIIFYTCTLLGICCVFAYFLHMHWKEGNLKAEERGSVSTDDFIFGILFLFIMASGCINLTTAVSLERRRGSPLLNRCLSWIILLSSPLLTLFTSSRYPIRLLTLCLSLFCPLTLMSVSYEPIFYACLSALLYVWLNIEERVEYANEVTSGRFDSERPLNVDDIRRAYFFVFFIFLSFFGTGNIASVNTFDPSFTASFVTIFSPFLMGTLLLTKIAIPFFIVCSFLCGLEAATSRNIGVIFWLIVMISDGMALRFFFLLRDQGSWLDIGTSISHFVICSATTLFVMVLYHLAKIALTKSLLQAGDRKWHVL